ncbi:ComEC/Rec2 family competence protein [Luteimonas huabeiensis]|uniref:ComEC/Rec2 family competence protein n=1 Tax=Luteimonas huabeiensis TaxID=1244513 RepID=UPI000463FD03|nr:ComEC/Rec2 family competence protein [Luteimonas huabeiensis]
MTAGAGAGPLGLAVAAALAAGALACLRLPALPPWPLWPVLVLAGGALWWRGGHWRWAGAAACGFAVAGLHAAFALSLQLPPTLERADVPLRGRVVGLPEHEAERTRFLFRVDRDAAMPAPLRGRLLRLAWYDTRGGGASARHAIEAGGRWAFVARLRAPRGLRNPGWFDSEKHAFARRIAAVGYVRDREPFRALRAGAGIDHWRERTAARIEAAVPGAASRYVRALALGDTRGLEELDWEALRATGLTHLIAISGFHVGLVAGFFALAVAGVWWAWPVLGRGVPRPQAAAAAAFAGALAYAAVAGWALPTVRTVLMIGVAMAARLSRRASSAGAALALAAIAVVLADPLLAAVRRRHPAMPVFAPAHAGLADTVPCLAGVAWQADGVSLRFLHPPLHFPDLRNEASCVLRVGTAHGAALLAGDIGAVVERELARRDPHGVRAEVVLAAHHGSETSSDPLFVAATGARHALVSTGHGNRFGHPQPAAVARWAAAGASLHDTAEAGALRVRFAPGGVSVSSRRATHPRLWDAARRQAADAR